MAEKVPTNLLVFSELDTYEASFHNETPPRREDVTEIQDREAGELLCYANPHFAERIISCVNGCASIQDPKNSVPELINSLSSALRVFVAWRDDAVSSNDAASLAAANVMIDSCGGALSRATGKPWQFTTKV